MANIYDLPLAFNLTRRYTVFSFKRYYGEFIITGKENIPTEGPVIFAPNHTNALMDAIAVHAIVRSTLPIIFLARADLFKNKNAAKFLRFVKIMPAFRMRDGMENLGRNNEVFDMCVEVLMNRKALGIMPEGNQEIERKLRPLVKGIFRIAFAAQQKLEVQTSVKIIPVGLDFGSIVKANKHIIINVGKPIDVADYMNSYNENPVIATNEIRDRLRTDLEKLSFNLATENYYECFETATETATASTLNELNLPENTLNRFKARQTVAERLVELESSRPERVKSLAELCSKYTSILKKLNLRSGILDKQAASATNLLLNGLLSIVTLPIFLIGFALNVIPFLAPVFIRKHIIKPEFTGFFSSLQFGLGMLTFPLCYILQTILFGCLISSEWWCLLLFFFGQFPLGEIALGWYSRTKKHIAKWRYKILEQKKSPELLVAQTLREQIIRMISDDSLK